MLKLGVWMVRQMNDIEEKIDELFDELKNKDIYLNYIKAKKQLKSNNEVTNIINKIKRQSSKKYYKQHPLKEYNI